MCGDYALGFGLGFLFGGPSPRAWGLLIPHRSVAPNVRAIPTCVGTTTPGSRTRPGAAGHPHVRGDYAEGEDEVEVPVRAIPTCVGTTRYPARQSRCQTGHPHVRGDYSTAPRATLGMPGHPHVRGDYPTRPGPRRPTSGHPHVRGDYPRPGGQTAIGTGPSPRAWGLRAPACPASWPPAGHPHVRGDYALADEHEAHAEGPSPRAWGLRVVAVARRGFLRAIPTCVGTTTFWPPGRG